jgi:hypothetical protein
MVKKNIHILYSIYRPDSLCLQKQMLQYFLLRETYLHYKVAIYKLALNKGQFWNGAETYFDIKNLDLLIQFLIILVDMKRK